MPKKDLSKYSAGLQASAEWDPEEVVSVEPEPEKIRSQADLPIFSSSGEWIGEVHLRKESWDYLVPYPDDRDLIEQADKLRSMFDDMRSGPDGAKAFDVTKIEYLRDLLWEEGFTLGGLT